MANFATLKAAIAAAIKQNGNNEITGALLQQQLLAMVNSLGAGYQYAGIATPSTNPGTPDQNVFYIASTAGTYTNFSGLVLDDGEIAILKYNGAWSKDSTGAASLEIVNQLGQIIGNINGLINYQFVCNAPSHSSANDKIPVDIKQGDTFSVTINAGTAVIDTSVENGRLDVRATKTDDSVVVIDEIQLGVKKTFTASYDIKALSFYIYKITTFGTCNVTIEQQGELRRIKDGLGVQLYFRTAPNINTTNGTITFPPNLIAFYDGGYFNYVGSGINLTIPLHPTTNSTTAWKLCYNTETHEIASFPFNEKLTNWIIIGFFYLASGTSYSGFNYAIFPFEFTIDGEPNKRTNYVGIIANAAGVPNIDTINHIVDMGDCIILYDNKYVELKTVWPSNPEKYRQIPYKVSGDPTSATKIIFNTLTNEFYPKNFTYKQNENEIVIGGIRSVYNSQDFVNAEFPFNYTIDKKPIDIDYYNRIYGGYLKNGLSYEGDAIRIVSKKYVRQLHTTLSPSYYHQSMAIYGDYAVFLVYNYNTSGQSENGKMTAHIYSVSTKTKLASLDVSYGNYTIPHCNTAVFGNEFAGQNSIMPLLYVSQWNGERNCLVYDITKVGDTYSISLVQVIGTSGVSAEKEGVGMRDWVVDTDNNKIYSIAYYLNSDRVAEGNKIKIMQFDLPVLNDGNIVFGESDIIDYYEQPFWAFLQDKFYNGGKIYIASGMSDYQNDTKIRVIDLFKKAVVTVVPLGLTYNLEPEGMDVYQNNLLLTYGNMNLYNIIAN